MKTSRTIITLGILFIVLTGAGCKSNSSPTSTTTPPTSTPEQTTIEFTNPTYGFTFILPKTWDGYTVVMQNWEGFNVEDNTSKYSGPQIIIRNPQWTSANPHQDIPLMVFTPAQWDLIKTEKLSVSAAPIPPSELGSNARYVFAIPARYNFAFPTGWEEAEKIISNNQPLKTF